jgi:hypothetical protein
VPCGLSRVPLRPIGPVAAGAGRDAAEKAGRAPRHARAQPGPPRRGRAALGRHPRASEPHAARRRAGQATADFARCAVGSNSRAPRQRSLHRRWRPAGARSRRAGALASRTSLIWRYRSLHLLLPYHSNPLSKLAAFSSTHPPPAPTLLAYTPQPWVPTTTTRRRRTSSRSRCATDVPSTAHVLTLTAHPAAPRARRGLLSRTEQRLERRPHHSAQVRRRVWPGVCAAWADLCRLVCSHSSLQTTW